MFVTNPIPWIGDYEKVEGEYEKKGMSQERPVSPEEQRRVHVRVELRRRGLTMESDLTGRTPVVIPIDGEKFRNEFVVEESLL